MKKRKLILVGVGLILISALSIGTVLKLNKNNENESNTDNTTGLDANFKRIENATREYDAKEEKRIAELVSRVTSVDSLKELDEADQAKVGVIILRQSDIDPVLARQYAAYLMLRSGSVGLEASKFCYKFSEGDTVAQMVCVQRANELARDQGIIKPGETLPEVYFKETPSSEELG
ncbi:hypothetical protein H0V99_00475 [Candidatus Saccharibacteria bacterium]|nr:hypothetical protein [Candidatus Saccharibacteria bacterium]